MRNKRVLKKTRDLSVMECALNGVDGENYVWVNGVLNRLFAVMMCKWQMMIVDRRVFHTSNHGDDNKYRS